MDTAAKTDAARTAFERPVLADQISSVGETKSKANEDGTKKNIYHQKNINKSLMT